MEYDVNTYEVDTNKGKRWVAEFPGVRGVAGLGTDENDAVLDLYKNGLKHVQEMQTMESTKDNDRYQHALLQAVIEVPNPDFSIRKQNELGITFLMNDVEYTLYDASDTATSFIALREVDGDFYQSRMADFDFKNATIDDLLRILITTRLIKLI